MIVLLEEIRADGLELDRELSLKWLSEVLAATGAGATTALRPLGPARLNARFDKISDKVLLKAKTEVGVAGACRRCLEEAKAQVPVDFTLSLLRKAPGSERDEEEDDTGSEENEGPAASFDLAAVEEEILESHEIDLGRLVREQLLLAAPVDLLCREDCKGLCGQCGQNLNEKACQCEPPMGDPRWAALKNIKLDH